METPIRLDLCKGVQPAIGDTETAEHGYDTMSLINPAGIALDTDGWTMTFPSLKNGGLWSDSALSDGRTLLAGMQANVTETLKCSVGNGDLAQRQAIIKKLRLFIQDARGFWQNCGQIEPVYLALHAAGAAAEQFALIYNIELATDTDPYDCESPWSFTLTIEREPLWRNVVPPGGNPRVYEFWRNNRIAGVHYGLTELELQPTYVAGDTEYRIVAEDTIYNRFEWTGGGTDLTSYLSHNWIDIDAEDIPGDADALIYLLAAPNTNVQRTSKMMIARYTGERTFYGRLSNATHLAHNIFAAADAAIGGVSAIAHDACGIKANSDAANGHIVTYSAAAAMPAWVRVLQWTAAQTLPNGIPMSVNEFRGTWAVFLRCQQTDGAQNDVQVRFVLEHGGALGGAISTRAILDPQYMPQITPAAACMEFRWIYLGQVTIPLQNQSFSSIWGYGLQQTGTGNDMMWLSVEVKNLHASQARALEFLDLALMPVHEAFTILDASGLAEDKSASTNSDLVYDNTSYSNHGNPEAMALYGSGAIDQPYGLGTFEIKGMPLTLKPGVNNRLYFIWQNYYAALGEVSVASAQYSIRLSIVPRCAGISDVEQLP